MTTFADLGLSAPILRAVEAENYAVPTPIQAQAIPHLLQGRDLLGCAQTGTGKTAAFALPILQRLAEAEKRPAPGTCRALVLTPTRELAAQIGESFATYGANLKLRHTVIFGGVGDMPQVQAVRPGLDIVVATPGRLLDLMQQGALRLSEIEIFVLDEADRMLDMGFIHDVRKVLKTLPARRQTLFFSATMPPEIAKLADSILTQPVRVEVAPVSSTAERIEQRVMFVTKADKKPLLLEVLKDSTIDRAIVFTRTKHGANKVAEGLEKAGVVAAAIHGNKSQNARTKALDGFREGSVRVLVATDIAARGIDVDGISHVINYDLPNIPESYVHRIGRTARAGRDGIAISFCDGEERAYLRDIEKLIGLKVPVVADHAWHDSQGRVTADPDERRGPRPPRNAPRRPQAASGSERRPAGAGASRPQGAGAGERRPQPAAAHTERRPQAQPGHGRPAAQPAARPVQQGRPAQQPQAARSVNQAARPAAAPSGVRPMGRPQPSRPANKPSR
ncbi:MAG TPA: DEAD/DEAH box helicase [Alphaproteobacteria bacterium]|nr:DEAD/DEAH box helicase [Alphaproteobacteria bacterium]